MTEERKVVRVCAGFSWGTSGIFATTDVLGPLPEGVVVSVLPGHVLSWQQIVRISAPEVIEAIRRALDGEPETPKAETVVH